MNDSTVNNIYQVVDFINAIFSIIAAGIAIYLFSKRKAISSIYHQLFNYAFQINLRELYIRVESLNLYKVDASTEQRQEVINIFDEIVGQISGDPILSKKCNSISKKLSKYKKNPMSLTEGMKRNLIAELRSTLNTINIQSYNESLGEKHE